MQDRKVAGSPMSNAEMPYLAAHLYIANMDALKAAMASPEGKASAKDLMGFAGMYVRMHFTEVVE